MKKLVLIVFGIFLLSGCTKINESKFESVLKEKGYEVTDVTGDYNFKKVLRAEKEDDVYIDFYVMDDEDSARDAFDSTRNAIESERKGKLSGYVSLSFKHYQRYSLRTKEKFTYMCRIDDTVVYTQVKPEYRKEVKSIIKDLGY